MKFIYLLFTTTLALTSFTSNAITTFKKVEIAQTKSQKGTTKPIKTINSTETKALLKDQKEVVILDVRTPQEYADGHLKNARLLNKYDKGFESKIKALDRNKSYLIYCAAGGRSGDAAQMMNKLGFTKIYDATDGFESLKKAGIPVEK